MSIGNYVEKAVLRSLGVNKNTDPLPGYDGGNFIPDIIEQSGTTEFEVRSPFPFPQQRRGAVFDDAQITEFPEFDQGHFGDVKTGPIVKNSRNQIKRMIQYLADQRGGYTYHNYQGGGGRSVRKNIRARDYGAAILTLITPAGTEIDPEILDFAEKRGVVVFQRTLEFNVNTGQMRVKAGRTQRTMLNTRYKYVQPRASDPVFIQLPK